MNKQQATLEHVHTKFEQLAEKMDIVERGLATKADDIVLTMTLHHGKEIEKLESEIIQLKSELERLKSTSLQHRFIIKKRPNVKKRFKLLPFLQKS